MEELVRRFGSHQHMVDVLLIHIRPRINQRNSVSSGNESSSPIILQEPIIQENLYCKSGLSSQTCWAQCGHLGPRNAKYWSPLISAKRISILITCDSEMRKKDGLKGWCTMPSQIKQQLCFGIIWPLLWRHLNLFPKQTFNEPHPPATLD